MKVIKNSIIYTVLSVLQKSVNFLLLPLYTAYLTPQDYGRIGVVTALSGMLTIFATLSLPAAVSKFYFDKNKEENAIRILYGTVALAVIISAFCLTLLLGVFHTYIMDPLADGVPFYPFLALGLVSVAFSPLYAVFQNIQQTEQNGKGFAINSSLFFLMNILLTIIAVLFLEMKAEGVIGALAITNICFFAYSIWNLRTRVTWRIDRAVLSLVMKYSLPLMPHALSGWIMTLFDRLLLNGLKDASTVGIYNVGYQFANIVNLLITSFERAYSPWFYSEADTESGRKKVALMAEMGMGAFASIGLAISLFSPEVIHLVVNERFERAWVVIPFLSSAFVVRGAYFFFIGPVFKSSTKSLPLITFSAALGGIGMNLLLIPYLGSVGSAIATMVSNFLSSILAKIVGSRFMVIPFRIKVIYGWWIFGFILSLFPLLELPISLVWAACIKIALLSVFCVFFIKYYAGELRSVVGPYYLRLRKRFRNEDQA